MACEPSANILFVDLDGVLVATDMLQESLLLAVKYDPLVLVQLPFWAAQGRAVLKRALAKRIMPDPELLPYRGDILEFLSEEKAHSRKLVLATASDELWAKEVARHMDLFDDVLASDGQRNLKGKRKLEAIKAYCQSHGLQEFAYIGDATADIPIWQQAAQAYVVEPTGRLLTSIQRIRPPSRIFGTRQSRLVPAIRALRPQQWVKNVLLFAPLLLAHELTSMRRLMLAVLAFVAFSIGASSGYVMNDLLDIEADRRHPTKRYRPFASGALPVMHGLLMGVSLLAFSITLAITTLPWTFVGVLLLYLMLTNLYSFWLKREVILDVLLLAGLYMLRILAGGMAVNIRVSEWLMAFSIFLFTSLAFVKRYAELARLSDEGIVSPKGRGYMVMDLSLIEGMGPTSGYMAVLVFALYIHSNDVQQLYTHIWALWLLCPLLLYWLSRIWLLAKRRRLPEDAIVFAFRDRVSLFIGAFVVVLVAIATSP